MLLFLWFFVKETEFNYSSYGCTKYSFSSVRSVFKHTREPEEEKREIVSYLYECKFVLSRKYWLTSLDFGSDRVHRR